MVLLSARKLLALVCLGSALWAAAEPGMWLDVPFVKQPRDGCGAAVIAMVMQYWSQQRGRAADAAAEVDAIQRALYSPDAHGIYASALERYFREHGFRAFAFAATWQDLQQHLQKGRPLIVALQPAPRAPLHYVVVVGLDPSQQLVLVNDPAERKLLKRDRSQFQKEWQRAAHWTLLAVPEQSRN